MQEGEGKEGRGVVMVRWDERLLGCSRGASVLGMSGICKEMQVEEEGVEVGEADGVWVEEAVN